MSWEELFTATVIPTRNNTIVTATQRAGRGKKWIASKNEKACKSPQLPLGGARSIDNLSAVGRSSLRELRFDEAQEPRVCLPPLSSNPSGRCFCCLALPGGQQEQQEDNITWFSDIKWGEGTVVSHRWQEPNPRWSPVGLSSVYFLSKGVVVLRKLWCASAGKRLVTMRPAAAALLKIAAANCFVLACRSGAAALFNSSPHCCKRIERSLQDIFFSLVCFHPRGKSRIFANNSRIKLILTRHPYHLNIHGTIYFSKLTRMSSFLLLPRPNRNIVNLRINWANRANLPKRLWWNNERSNKWES